MAGGGGVRLLWRVGEGCGCYGGEKGCDCYGRWGRGMFAMAGGGGVWLLWQVGEWCGCYGPITSAGPSVAQDQEHSITAYRASEPV